MMRTILLAVVTIAVSACAGMSKDECLVADWRAIGYEDGARGLAVSAVSGRRQACAKKAGVMVDMNAYLAGREAGLVHFCRPNNGFTFGANGGRYQGVCTGATEQAFFAAYQKGSHLYELSSRVDQAESRIASAERRLSHKRKRIKHVQQDLASPETENEARVDLAIELAQLFEERERIKDDIDTLYAEKTIADADLAEYQDILAADGYYYGANAAYMGSGY